MNIIRLYSAVCFFLLGLCAGSFLNACIYRIPLGIPLVKGCFFLKGKGRRCKKSVPASYPITEVLTGIVWSCACLTLGLTLYLVFFCLFSAALILAAGIDRKHLYIPDRVPASIAVLALLSAVWGPKTSVPCSPSLVSRLLGGGVISLFMLAVSAASHGGIGGGDIKLLAASGLFLGFSRNLTGFFLAYILAGIFYLIPFIRGTVSRKSAVPMAPFFAASLIFAGLWGRPLLNWYFHLVSRY